MGEHSPRRGENAVAISREFRSPAAGMTGEISCNFPGCPFAPPDKLPPDGQTVSPADSEVYILARHFIVCSAGSGGRSVSPIPLAPGRRSFRLWLGDGPRGSFHRDGTRLQQSLRRQYRPHGMGTTALSVSDGRSLQALRYLHLRFGVGSAE